MIPIEKTPVIDDQELPQFSDIASFIAINSEIVSYGEWIKLNTRQKFEVLEHSLIKIYNLKKNEYQNRISQNQNQR